MSVKRLHEAVAKQRYARERTGETIEVQRRGRTIRRRVSKADKSQPKPNYRCGKCGDEITPGTRYRYWLPYFRSNAKSIRCMKPACYPRPSERESSLMADVMRAVEDAEDAIENASTGDVDSIREALDAVGDACSEVAQQYRDAAEHFGGYGENAERADELEYVDMSWDPSESEDDQHCDDHDEYSPECDDCVDALDQWWSGVQDEAKQKLEEVPG
jgi:hypothetical protein